MHNNHQHEALFLTMKQRQALSVTTAPLTKLSSPLIKLSSPKQRAGGSIQKELKEPDVVSVVEATPVITPVTAKKRKTSFDRVEVIEFPIILGDHPCVQDGPPVSVCWNPQLRFSVGLDRFEEARRNHRRAIPRRISKSIRQKVLARHGFSQRDMDRATIEAKKIRLERFLSSLPWSSAPPPEEANSYDVNANNDPTTN